MLQNARTRRIDVSASASHHEARILDDLLAQLGLDERECSLVVVQDPRSVNFEAPCVINPPALSTCSHLELRDAGDLLAQRCLGEFELSL